jgi:site-specific recombinase XerC
MSHFAIRGRAPRALTAHELERVLRVSGEHVRGFRDHCIIALAVGAGLREHEIAALDVIDVVGTMEEGTDVDNPVRRRVQLRVWKGHVRARRGKTGKWRKRQPQEVILSDECRRKLNKWVSLLRWSTGRLVLTQPLFASRQNARISTRTIRAMWRRWQTEAGFESLLPFHVLRHTYVTNAYRSSGNDIRLAQRLARHSRVETTAIYAHPDEDQVLAVARKTPS